MPKVAQPPPQPRELHYWIEGREVTPEAFWEAVKHSGRRAVVDAVERRAPAYRPTEAGRAALSGSGARPGEAR
jgi:hypothetical protein